MRSVLQHLHSLFVFSRPDPINWSGGLEILGWTLLILALTSYIAMNFTGSSTYTSLSGVRKEMRLAVPLEIGAGVLGLGLWVSSLIMA